MHGHVSEPEFLRQISGFLGCYYLALAIMNGLAAFYLWRSGRSSRLGQVGKTPITTATVWLLVSVVFLLMSPIAMSGNPDWMRLVSIPEVLRNLADFWMGPVVYSVGTLVVLAVMFFLRDFFV